MDNNPEAAGAVPAPQTEATPTNTNPEPAQAAPAPAPDLHGFTSEQLADMQKFFQANGGFDAVKSKISNPAPKTEAPKAEAPQAAQPAQATVQKQPDPMQEPADGFLSPNQIARIQYRNFLVNDKKYEGLQDYIEKGEFLKEMEDLGMKPVDAQGNVNDRTIRAFLDLKVKTLPATPQVTPASTATPTADYVNVGEEITSREDAFKVMSQPGHPLHDKAMEYMRTAIFGAKPTKPVEKK